VQKIKELRLLFIFGYRISGITRLINLPKALKAPNAFVLIIVGDKKKKEKIGKIICSR